MSQPRPSLDFDIQVRLGRERPFELLAAGRFVGSAAVLGPSGAGKTTLLRALAGLVPADGRIEVDGRVLLDGRRSLPPERRHLGYVPQDGALFPHRSVLGNLLFGRPRGRRTARSGGDPELEAVVDALDLEPLLARSPRHLSGGEVRRVAVGRALLSRPRLLLLDEPTAGLDRERARRVLGHLTVVRRQLGVPLVTVTHRLDEAVALADEILHLEAGRVTATGPARQMAARLAGTGGAIESLVRAIVSSHAAADGVTRARLASGEVVSLPHAPELAVGRELLLAVGAGDVLVARGAVPTGLSARNAITATIESLEPAPDPPGATTLLLRSGPWLALLTPEAVRELGLAPGVEVHLIVKTHSWRLVA